MRHVGREAFLLGDWVGEEEERIFLGKISLLLRDNNLSLFNLSEPQLPKLSVIIFILGGC